MLVFWLLFEINPTALLGITLGCRLTPLNQLAILLSKPSNWQDCNIDFKLIQIEGQIKFLCLIQLFCGVFCKPIEQNFTGKTVHSPFYLSWQLFVTASLDVNETQQQQQHSNNVYHDLGLTRNKIVTAQFECYQKIMKDNTESREGTSLCFVFNETPFQI